MVDVGSLLIVALLLNVSEIDAVMDSESSEVSEDVRVGDADVLSVCSLVRERLIVIVGETPDLDRDWDISLVRESDADRESDCVIEDEVVSDWVTSCVAEALLVGDGEVLADNSSVLDLVSLIVCEP